MFRLTVFSAVLAGVFTLCLPECSLRADVFFEEHFTGTSLNPSLEGSGFTIADGVIRRGSVVNHDDRQYIRTVASNYIDRNFVYELTLNTVPIGYTGVNFIGIGEGVGSGQYNEPQNSIHYRIHSSNVHSGQVDVFWRTPDNPMGTGEYAIGYLPADGPHRVKIEKTGNNLTFSIDSLYDGTFAADFSHTIPDIESYAPFLSESGSHLFFGTAVTQHSFDDLTIAHEPSILNNASFEADTFGVYPGYISSNSSITGWTSTNSSATGLNPAGGGSPFANNGTIPAGSQVAFIQNGGGDTGSLSQTLTGLVIGETYRVSYRYNARSYGTNPKIKVTMGGTVLQENEFPPVGDANPYYLGAREFTATATEHDLVFENTRGVGDSTLVLDDGRLVHDVSEIVERLKEGQG